MMTLQQLFAIELPIIQAPMAGVQGSAMAIAVSNAGGLGSLPCAMLSADSLRQELTTIKAQTDKPYNLNFFCHTPPVADVAREALWLKTLSPYFNEFDVDPATLAKGPGRTPFSAEIADLIEGFKPPVISFHFGLPSAQLMSRVRSWGARIIACATTVAEAVWLEAQGVDAIIAQGWEAGGHRGIFLSTDLNTQLGTFALVSQMRQVVRVPIIAAGGIANAQDVAAVMQLGAAGAQLGTSYLLCPEASTSAWHRAALQSEHCTAITNIFTGRPARGIVNRIMREIGPISASAPEFPLATAAVSALRAKAESRQSGDFSPLWAGQNTSGCSTRSAADITRALMPG